MTNESHIYLEKVNVCLSRHQITIHVCSYIQFILTSTPKIALLLGEEDIDGALEAFEGLVNATAEPLFPSNVNTAIEDVDELLTLLEDQAAFGDAQNVREKNFAGLINDSLMHT